MRRTRAVGDERRQRKSGDGPGEAEHAAFDEQLRDDAAAVGAEGVAHGHLASAGRGAQEQQRGHVDGAHGDQQTGHAHEDDRAASSRSMRPGEKPVESSMTLRCDLSRKLLLEVFGGILVERELCARRECQSGARPASAWGGYAGLEARYQSEPDRLVVVEVVARSAVAWHCYLRPC